MRRTCGALTIALLLGLAVGPASAQCAMCRTALASEESAGLAERLNAGILLMLAAPFGVASSIGLAMMRQRRRSRL